MCNILVTGGNGQLGQELNSISTDYPNCKFHFYTRDQLDITDAASVDLIFRKYSFQYLVNCAAYTKVDQAEKEKTSAIETNVKAVELLALACKKFDTVFIHISSDYVYNPEHNFPNSETMSCDPQGAYAESKRAGEKILQTSNIKYIIIRSSWIYSSFGHNFVKTMLKLGKERTELQIVDDQIGSPTYARDLAKFILDMILIVETADSKDKYWGIYNYSNLGFISWAEFAEEIFRISELNVNIIKIPTSEYPTPAPRPLNSRMSKSKITDVFQLRLMYWKKSLRKCLEEIDN